MTILHPSHTVCKAYVSQFARAACILHWMVAQSLALVQSAEDTTRYVPVFSASCPLIQSRVKSLPPTSVRVRSLAALALTSVPTGILTPTRHITARYPCRGVVCCGGMSEKEPQSVTPRPEEILTTQEAEVLQKAEAGVLPCPRCGQMLRAEMIVSGDYEGVLLSCPDRGSCGFREC